MNTFTPRKFTLEAMRFLISRPFAGLLLDMGLGKTGIVLAVLETLKEMGKLGKVFLLAPIRTLYTVWPAEILKWDFGLTYHNLHESRLMPTDDLPDVDIYGINPESSLKWISEWRQKVMHAKGITTLIVDESSLYKNPASVRFKELRHILHWFERRWILTGTPAPNGLMDLWSQIFILDQGAALGRYITHFRNAFCQPDFSGYDWMLRPGSTDEIYRRIKPLVLRFDAKDHLDMPELVHNKVPVKLPPPAMKQYKEMEKTFLLLLEEETIMSPNTAVAGMKCRQIANGGIYDAGGGIHQLHNAKTEALVEIMEELQGKPVIVFYEFKHDAERIAAALGSAPELTPENITKFQQGKLPWLMGHWSQLAFGLNLQESCHNIVAYGLTWDLAAYDQAIARVWRSGQKSGRVFVHNLVAQDTIDEDVLKELSNKDKTQKSLLNAMKGKKV